MRFGVRLGSLSGTETSGNALGVACDYVWILHILITS